MPYTGSPEEVKHKKHASAVYRRHRVSEIERLKEGMFPAPQGARKKYLTKYGRDNKQARKGYEKAAFARSYGLTLAQLEKLHETYRGLCGLCGEPEIVGSRRLAIDHDHTCCPGKKSCGKCIRGLICSRCNLGLGHFRHNPKLLGDAILYLRLARVKLEAEVKF